jgi:hypothetical protein
VFVADAGGRAVAIRETDKLSGGFATTDEVRAVADRLETWSRLVFSALVDAERIGLSAGTSGPWPRPRRMVL